MGHPGDNDGGVRGGGVGTGPLPVPGSEQHGQPTIYVPPEIRPQGTNPPNYHPNYPGYANPSPTMPVPLQPLVGAQARHHNRRHRTSALGPLLLIGAGVVFLLNNLGLLPWSVWETLGRLWPLFLIAIGLDLIIGRRSPIISLLIALGVVGAGAAIVYANGGFVMRGGGGTASMPLSIDLAGAGSANVKVSMSSGALVIGSMGSSPKLVSGTLEYSRSAPPQQEVSKGDVVRVELSQQHSDLDLGFFSSGKPLHWDVNLNKNVPTDLHVEQGTGNVTLNLQELKLKSLNFDAGAGNSTIMLPSSAGLTSVEINGGVGNITLVVPQGVEARLMVESGIGNTSVDPRFVKQGDSLYQTSGFSASDKGKNRLDIKLDHGVGNVDVR